MDPLALCERVHDDTNHAASGLRDRARAKLAGTWLGEKAWPLVKIEAEIVVRAAAVITLVLWAKRVIEQLLGAKILNEAIIRGQWNDLINATRVDADIRSRS